MTDNRGGTSGPGKWGPEEKESAAKQRRRVWMIMIDWEWHTLSELHILTGDPEASVSARLRDLRKKKFGGYDVLRRRVLGLKIYEYRVVEPAGGA